MLQSANPTAELERQLHELGECVIVSGDKNEQALQEVIKQLRAIVGGLAEITRAIRSHEGHP